MKNVNIKQLRRSGSIKFLGGLLALTVHFLDLHAQKHFWTLGWESYIQRQYHKNLSAAGLAVVYEQPVFRVHPNAESVIRARIGQADGMFVFEGRESMHLNASVEAMIRLSLLEKWKISPIISGGAGIHYRESLIEHRGFALEPTRYSIIVYPAPVAFGGFRVKIRKRWITAGLHLRRTNDIDEWGYSVLFRW
jgi:hypothetical protein